MSEAVWEKRYRYLESQFEALLSGAAERMSKLEDELVTAQKDVPTAPRIREVTVGDGRRITCSADGTDLKFRFVVKLGDTTLKDTNFQRENTIQLPQPGGLEVLVVVTGSDRADLAVEQRLQLPD